MGEAQLLVVGRTELANLIVERLQAEAPRMSAEFHQSGRIPTTYIDDLLPPDLAREIFNRFPETDRMMLRHSIKERKLTSAQMDRHHPQLEEAVFAFQDARVVDLIAQITGLGGIVPDEDLYAGGISVMAKGGYLRP